MGNSGPEGLPGVSSWGRERERREKSTLKDYLAAWGRATSCPRPAPDWEPNELELLTKVHSNLHWQSCLMTNFLRYFLQCLPWCPVRFEHPGKNTKIKSCLVAALLYFWSEKNKALQIQKGCKMYTFFLYRNRSLYLGWENVQRDICWSVLSWGLKLIRFCLHLVMEQKICLFFIGLK